MGGGVYSNGNAVAAKIGGGKVISAFPDVCMSPPGPKAGPIPIPYPNTSFSEDLKNGTKTVSIGGKPIAVKNSFYKTAPLGDEAATQAYGCSVVSGTITGITEFITYSFDVKIEDRNVCRHSDLTTSNNRSTPPAPNIEDTFR